METEPGFPDPIISFKTLPFLVKINSHPVILLLKTPHFLPGERVNSQACLQGPPASILQFSLSSFNIAL